LTINWNVGSGYNEFNKDEGIMRIFRYGWGRHFVLILFGHSPTFAGRLCAVKQTFLIVDLH
jgi:hypothetical protein